MGGAGLLAYLAALLLIPSDDAPPLRAAEPSRNRWLAIVGVVVLLCITWPFLLGGGLVLGFILVPFAILVAAGVLVWWFVSGEGPGADAGDIAKRAALGIGILVLCGLIAIAGAWAAAAGGETVVAIVVIAAGAAILLGAFLRPVRWLVLPAVALALSAGAVSAAGHRPRRGHRRSRLPSHVGGRHARHLSAREWASSSWTCGKPTCRPATSP